MQLDVGDAGPVGIRCVQADSQFALVHDDIFYRRIRVQGSAVVHFHLLAVGRETGVSINRSESVGRNLVVPVGKLVTCICEGRGIRICVPSFHESGLLQFTVVLFRRFFVVKVLDIPLAYVFGPSVS